MRKGTHRWLQMVAGRSSADPLVQHPPNEALRRPSGSPSAASRRMYVSYMATAIGLAATVCRNNH